METVGGLNVMEEGGGGLTASHSVGEVLELGVEGGGTTNGGGRNHEWLWLVRDCGPFRRRLK